MTAALAPNARLPRWVSVRLVRDRNAEPAEPGARPVIRGPADVVALVGPEFAASPVERFAVLCLDVRGRLLVSVTVTVGLLDSSLVHAREVFRPAILAGAASVILVHNHPSGDPTPSAEDRALTRQLCEAGRLLDMPVLDHVVLGAGRHFAFSEGGLL